MDVVVTLRTRTGSRPVLSEAGVAARAVADPADRTTTGAAASIAACANIGTTTSSVANAATHDGAEPTVVGIATAHNSFATCGDARTVALATVTAAAGTRATLECPVGAAAFMLACVDSAVATAARAAADHCTFHAATGLATRQPGRRCHRWAGQDRGVGGEKPK